MPENSKRLIGNFMSLGFQRGIAIVFPLLVFPYLLRVLGFSGFGVFTLVQTGIMYFDLLIAFGFGLTATQRIAKTNGDVNQQQKIILSVYLVKLILFAASLCALLLSIVFIPYLRQNIFLLLFAALYLLGNLLFPDWYYQGIQKMKNCTFITLISKLISLVLIIVLVKGQNDIDKAFFALAAGNVLAGGIGFILLWKQAALKFYMPDKKFVLQLFKESSYVFASIILAPLYSSVNIFILQLFANPLIVGSYSVAQKIFSAAGMLTGVVNNTYFPHLSQLYASSPVNYKKEVKRLLKIIGLAFFTFSLIQFLFADDIMLLLAGKNSGEDIAYAVTILQIMSFALFFSPYVSFFFQQMIIQHQQKQAIFNIVIAIAVNLISAVILAYWYSGIGMAINGCLVVVLISFLNAYSVSNKIGWLPSKKIKI